MTSAMLLRAYERELALATSSAAAAALGWRTATLRRQLATVERSVSR